MLWENVHKTEAEMAGWHKGLNGHELEQTQRDSGGQGSLACCSPWGCRKSDTTWRLNNTRSKCMGCVYGLEAGEVDGEEIPTALSVMVYSLLKESTLVPAEGPKLSVKGTSPADMDTGKTTNPSAISQVDLPLLLSFCFHPL